MKILINDANILIDLANIQLLEEFALLPFSLYTTDFVYAEITLQQQEINTLINSRSLTIIQTENLEDFLGINQIVQKSSGVSFEDCSVWYYASKLNGVLLSGDGNLRKQATRSGIEVRGILFILDELVRLDLIGTNDANKKIQRLSETNTRLPKDEIKKRLKLWSNQTSS